jgi:hypothetical protein
MGDKITENVGMNDLERGVSKDVAVLNQASAPVPLPTITTSHPKRSMSYKYLLLGVFCLGVFIDGESPL